MSTTDRIDSTVPRAGSAQPPSEWLPEGGCRSPERGASLIEYALLVALIAIVCVGAVALLGEATSAQYSPVTETLSN